MKICLIIGFCFAILLQSVVIDRTDGERNNDGLVSRYNQVSPTKKQYSNPIIYNNLPDPSVIKSKDGFFYLYATEDIRNVPIYKSLDLVNWEFVGTAFTEETRPHFMEKGMIWAPDINYINRKYVLFYSLSKANEFVSNGIGVAVSEKAEGPFKDVGKLFTSREIEVSNSIDEFYFKDKGHHYLFWGSFSGIYGIELSKDGLSIRKGSKKKKIAGTFMEATAIEKRNGYYYLFGSEGSCCEGDKSTYRIVYGRSKSLFGPYVTKAGKLLLENNYEVLLHGNNKVAGPGHQSRLITDDIGQDWIIYHGYLRDNPLKGRVVFVDKIEWIDNWPTIMGSEPSSIYDYPYLK